ncbi:MAG: Anaerobic magnesium-protoporphyrin monomethyl ester cyclase [Chloroflexota bacterium]|nr:Anaerobic magnesium-protoporphyrin monomethyl ester cyclase [Chloroflexota bacterium]
MNIFLVYPHFGLEPSYNCGLGYIAAVLQKELHAVSYLRLGNDADVAAFLLKITREQPDIIGFSLTTCQLIHVKRILPLIRQQSRALLVAGGIHPTVEPACLEQLPELDAIVRGEGEWPMRDLAAALRDGQDYRSLAGFCFRTAAGTIGNGLRRLIPDLDALPFPYHDPADYQAVIDASGGMHRMIFSRGCTFGCPYCSNDALRRIFKGQGTYHRARSPEQAIAEIARDARQFRFGFLFFDDDALTLDKDWCLEFMRLYGRKFAYPFYCNVRPGTLDGELIAAIAAAGARGIALGVEHGNEAFRRTVLKRNVSDAAIRRTVELCRQAGIKEVYGQVMIGLPHENLELYLDSVRLCRSLGVIPFRYIYSPYPGTELGLLCAQHQWLPDKESFTERREAVIDFPGFRRADIQLGFDVFSLLVRLPLLPLRVPGITTSTLLRIYRPVVTVLRPAVGALWDAWQPFRQWVVVRPHA